MTEFAATVSPARAFTSSIMPSLVAGIHRISSGTRVPRPRTWRNISPRLTVSIHTVARSTDGAAGLMRERPRVTADAAVSTRTAYTAFLIFLFMATDLGRDTFIIPQLYTSHYNRDATCFFFLFSS